MSQVSYGTITITDMNDIEEIYTIYAGSNTEASPTFTYAAVTDGTTWKRNASTLSGFKYIWQSTVVTKSGVTINSTNWQEFYSQPVRLTGLEGDDARNITDITPYYYLSTSDSSQTGGSWSTTPQAYPSTGTAYYWTKTITTYDSGSPTESTAVLDMFLTNAAKDARDANETAAIANSIAQHANEDAQGALSQAAAARQLATQVDTLLGGHFMWHGSALSTNTKAGARVVEQIKENGTDISSNPAKWHHNVNIGADGIQLRYNEAVMAQLAANLSGNTALKFYRPPTVSSSTTEQGALAMELNTNALNFYGSSTVTADATLTSTGLKLAKGGIIVNTPGANNGVYISSDNLGSKVTSLNADKTDWRVVIGSKFGVDSEGNLYANNAKISGDLTTGTISGSVTIGGKAQSEYLNDNIIIGGRNLLTNIPTVWKLATIDSTGNYGTDTTTAYFAPTDTEDGDTWAIDVNSNTEYTITAYNDYNSDNISVNIYELKMTGNNYTFIKSSGWKNCTTSPYTFTTSSTTTLLRLIFSSNSNNRTISETLVSQVGTDLRIQLEKGNKATDWTPDYEDVTEQTNVVYDMAKKSVIDIDDLYIDTLGSRIYYLYQGDYSFQITKDEVRDSLKIYYVQTSTSYREAMNPNPEGGNDFIYFTTEYALTSDTEITTGKIYYELVDEEYIEVINPIVDNISNYYELVEHAPLFELIPNFTNVYYDEDEEHYYYTDNNGQIIYMQDDSSLEKTFEYNLTSDTNINIYTVYTERKFEIVSENEYISPQYYYITMVDGQPQKNIITNTNFNNEYSYTIDGIEKTLYYTYGDSRHWYYLEENQPIYPTITSGTQPTEVGTIYSLVNGREGGLQGDISLLQTNQQINIETINTLQTEHDRLVNLSNAKFDILDTYLGSQGYISLVADSEEPYLQIGKRQLHNSDQQLVDSFHVRLTPTQLGFYEGDAEDPIAYLSNEQLYIKESTILENQKIGNFKWTTAESRIYLRYDPN